MGDKKAVRRSIVAKVEIPEGAVITEDMLEIKRLGTGLKPKYFEEVIGKMAKVTIKQDELLALTKLKSG